MSAAIMKSLHSAFLERCPQLPMGLVEFGDGRCPSLLVDGIFCDLEILLDDDDTHGDNSYSWYLMEGCDPLRWEDGPDSDDFCENRKCLDGSRFDPADPEWDPEDMVIEILYAMRRHNTAQSNLWYQRRIEDLNLVTKNLQQALAHTAGHQVEATITAQ